MNDQMRSAAKRRASFARAERLAREAANQTERNTDARSRPDQSNSTAQRLKEAIKAERRRDAPRHMSNREARKEEQRRIERQKAEDLRRQDSIKAALRRAEMARKQTEQRRIERLRAATQREFARKAENRVAAQKQLDQQRREAARHDAQKRYDARHDQNRERAVLQAKERETRHLADQQAEHRRQTDRLRKRHAMETRSHKDNENAAVALHARKIQNIDLAEARELKELAARNRSLKGRITTLVRGPGHADRQERAIIDRHEAARMQAHRNHEVLKDRQFEAAQASRIRHAHERKAIFDQNRTERRDLVQAHERDRPHQIERHRLSIEAAQLRQERDRTLSQTFEHGRSHNLKR